MKQIMYILALLVTIVLLVSCGVPVVDQEIMPTAFMDVTTDRGTAPVLTDNPTSFKIEDLYGIWLITETAGGGYVVSVKALDEAYIGATLLIEKDIFSIECEDESLNKTFKDPVYIFDEITGQYFVDAERADITTFGLVVDDIIVQVQVSAISGDYWFYIKDANTLMLRPNEFYYAKRMPGCD